MVMGQRSDPSSSDVMLMPLNGFPPTCQRLPQLPSKRFTANHRRHKSSFANHLPRVPMISSSTIYTLSLSLVLALCIFQQVSANIPSPPSMVKQPGKEQLYQVAQTVDEPDRPFVLDCEATGNPEPTYTWKKNGLDFDYVAYDKRISQQPRRGTLVFTKPDNVDEGLYQCFASNLHGTAMSNAVFLRRAELNSFPDEMPETMYVEEGKPHTIDCNPPSGYPKPQIFWIIHSSAGALRSINSSRLTVDPEGRLHFSNVTRDDELYDSTYACSATSVFRTEYKIGRKTILQVSPSGSAGLSSHPPEKQYLSPPSVPALKGKKLELHCIVGGTPLPDIVWSKRFGSLEGNKYTYINYGKTLVIKKVDFEDEGTYECTASNGVGNQISHAMTVIVQSEPFWTKVSNNTNAAEGEDVKFECVASGIPEPRLQWLINGKPISDGSGRTAAPRRKIEGNTLTISNLFKTDTSVIQCNASNAHGYAFQDFYLNVLALPPSIIDPPEKITRAVVTSNVIIRCRVFGAPKPVVKWRRDGREIIDSAHYRILEDGDLEIYNLLITDQGTYQCVASNKFGEIEAVGKLHVKSKTRITQPPENFEVAADKMAVLRCTADADPTLPHRIEWLFNGRPIDFDHDPRLIQAADNSLIFSKTKELDSGRYTCVAKTELDEVRSTATLIVQDVPNKPMIMNVECMGLTAEVEWQPTGDRRAPILSYAVQHNTSFTPDTWQDSFSSVPAPDTKVTASMTPWANYTFRVIARNKIGPSEPSDPSGVCSTEEDVPHKHPENVAGRGSRPDNLVISWTPMAMIQHHAPGFFYKVYWKRQDVMNDPWKSATISDWTQSTYEVPGQPTFRPYMIKVEAHNRRGQANTQSQEVLGWSGEDLPSQAPGGFQVQRILDAKTAVLSWNPVARESLNGHFRGYKIQSWTGDDGEDRSRVVEVNPNVTNVQVTIFKPHSKNYVRVVAFNDRYDGPPSELREVITPEGVPGPVPELYAVPMGSSAIYLVWDKPAEPNGVLTGYRIYYQEVDGTQLGPKLERIPAITEPNVTKAKLAGLRPATKYRVTIHATTRAGQGEEFYVEKTTKKSEDESKPDTPAFAWYKLPDEGGQSGVRITWLPSTNQDRPGSHFFVQYRRKGEHQFESTPPEENKDSVIIRGLETNRLYEFRVVAVDGRFSTPSDISEVPTGPTGSYGPLLGDPVAHFAKADWFILLICTIALIITCSVLVCVVKRNRGGKYAVHEKEVAQGRDGDYEEGGFEPYTKPGRDGSRFQPILGGRDSAPLDPYQGGESDTDSMAEYIEGDSSKFGEDGSFIGQYGSGQRNRNNRGAPGVSTDPASPSGMATFV